MPRLFFRSGRLENQRVIGSVHIFNERQHLQPLVGVPLLVLRGWLSSFHDNYSISTLVAGNFRDGLISVRAEHV